MAQSPQEAIQTFLRQNPYQDAIRVLKRLVETGYTLVLYTCREDYPTNINKRYLSDAVKFLEENGINIKYANQTPEWYEFRDEKINSHKVHADIYLDDKCFPFGFDWKFYEYILLDIDYKEFNKVEEKVKNFMKKIVDKHK